MNQASNAYRWNILVLLMLSQVIAYVDRVNISVVGPELIRSHGYTPALMGTLISIFNWAFTASLLLAGPVTDWVKPKTALPLGVGTWSLATLLCSTTVAFTPLAVFRALVGVGESSMIPSGSRVIRETFDKKNRALVVATFFAGNRMGLSIGNILAAFVLVYWGWSAVYYVTGALGLFWLAWWLAVYRPPPRPAEPAETENHIRWATLLRYRTTWGVMLGQSGYLYIYYVFAAWLPGYLVIERGMTAMTTGYIGMLTFLLGTVCVIGGGWLGDLLIARTGKVTAIRKSFAVGGLFAATLFTVALAYADSTNFAVAMMMLAVASFSFTTGAANSMPIDVAPKHIVSSLVSLQNFGGNVGGSFAPVVTGFLVMLSGDFTLPLLVAAGVALVFGCGSYGFIVGDLDRELQRSPA